MHYATLKTHHSFHAKQNCIPIVSFLPQSVNGTTYHNQQEMPNHSKYSKPNFKLKNTFNYNSGARINQILHCRLRLGCSSLNHDLYRKKHHKFPVMHLWSSRNPGSLLILHCPNYIVQRHQYFRNLPCPITVNNLLYGDDRLPPDINAQIVMSLHNYITSTKRFGS